MLQSLSPSRTLRAVGVGPTSHKVARTVIIQVNFSFHLMENTLNLGRKNHGIVVSPDKAYSGFKRAAARAGDVPQPVEDSAVGCS